MSFYSRDPNRRHNEEYPSYSRNESEYVSRMQRNDVYTINDLNAKLRSANEQITKHVDANYSLQREIEYVSSERCKERDILKRIIESSEVELSATKEKLKNQFHVNVVLKRKMDNASDESSNKKSRLNQTIKDLEEVLRATKTELKEQVFANTLAVAETTSLKNQIQTSALENIESKEQKDCEINGLKQLLEKSNAENAKLNEQIRAGRQEINNFKMKWQNARKQFGELERMHKINANLMKSIQSSLSSDDHLDVSTSQNSQKAGTLTQALDGNDSDFACKKCNKGYKLKSSLFRHIKEKHTEDLQKDLLLSSAMKRTKSRVNTLF